MDILTIIKIVVTTLVQIELSPQFWRESGFTHNETRTIVISLSFVALIINVSILRLGIYLLGVNPKPKLGYKIAKKIHVWGLIGLFVAGIIPWPIFIGVAQPLSYLLYCEVEEKKWYNPNVGLMVLVLGIIIKMLLLTNNW